MFMLREQVDTTAVASVLFWDTEGTRSMVPGYVQGGTRAVPGGREDEPCFSVLRMLILRACLAPCYPLKLGAFGGRVRRLKTTVSGEEPFSVCPSPIAQALPPYWLSTPLTVIRRL